MDPLPPPIVLRKSSTSSPSNMMETSIDEGIETEEPDCEDDPPHLLSAYQTARFGQRRHTLSEVTNQPGPSSQGTQTPRHPEMHLNEGGQTIEFFKLRLSSEIPWLTAINRNLICMLKVLLIFLVMSIFM